MNGLKRLIHEVHRRSLWQVLAVYLVGSWVALQVVDTLTQTAGLPDWVPPFALVLLIIGFPIVTATAVVQEGIGGAPDLSPTPEPREERPSRPALDEDLGPAPTGVRRLFTWRNAIAGGVAAFALLGVSVAAYLVMWSTGIGPVGNLVAQGVIEQGDRVVLATFTDRTDEGLGSVVTGALRVDLAQGAILTLVEESELGPVLERMQVEPGTPITGEFAREAAVREGIGAVLDGEVARAGTGYLITADLREAASGRSMAAFRVAAEGPDEIIPAIDRLSREIRAKAGESLQSVRAGEALERVTTRSLEALRLFTEADQAFTMADYRQAIELLEQALAIDPEFAMAWRRMATALSNTGTDLARQMHASTQAYVHRNRLTERERYLAEANYFSTVEQDRARTITAYQNVLRVEPDDRAALNNLANEYITTRDLARAEELYRRAVNGPGRSNTAFGNLIIVQIMMGDLAGAEATFQAFEQAYPDNGQLPEWAFWLAFLRNDLEPARALVAPQRDDLSLPAFVRADAHFRMALTFYREGRLDEGRAHALAAERVAGEVGAAFQASQRLWTAHADEVLGDREWARAQVLALVDNGTFTAIDPDERPWWFASIMLAFLEERDRAERVMADWEAHLDSRGADDFERIGLRRARITLDAGTGRAEGTLEALEALAVEFGCPTCWAELRSIAAAREGRTDEAIRLYEELAAGGHDLLYLYGTFQVEARLMLGPLYEEAGDTASAVAAYQWVVREWADADARGMERVREAEARIAALTAADGP